MAFNATNPVSVGLATKADHYNRVFDNTLELRTGGIAIASQAALDFLHASSATQLARVAAVASKYPRLNAGGTAWEMNIPTVGRHDLWVPAAAMVPSTTAGCGWHEQIAYNDWAMYGMPFDPAGAESAQFGVRLPKSWNESSMKARIYWLNKAGGAGNVVWYIYTGSAGDGEAAGAFGGGMEFDYDAAQTAYNIQITAEYGNVGVTGSPVAGDLMQFKIYRYTGSANDTYGSDAYLLGVMLALTTDAETDD